MESSVAAGILRICQVLNDSGVEYLLVGGTAVALHGYFRQSVEASGALATKPDLDFWYNPTYANYFRLLDALASLGQDVRAFKAEQTPNPRKSFFKYEYEEFTLDLLPAVKAPLTFAPAYHRKETAVLNGIAIPFIGYDDLLLDKAASARAKDTADIEQLKNSRKMKG